MQCRAQAVSTLLCAHTFLGNNHTFDVDAELGTRARARSQWEENVADSLLGMPQTEVFELFARHRCKLLRYLESHAEHRDAAMEAVVRTVTCTGPRQLPAAAARAALRPRHWHQLEGFKGLGRYVPDTVSADANKRAESAGGALADGSRGDAKAGKGRETADRLESWLRAVTSHAGVEAEINVQLGEFSLRKQPLAPLPSPIRAAPDFASALGDMTSEKEPMQSVLISATTERRWYRLVGQRADVRVWSARPADELGAASGRRCRAYPSGLNPRENWVREVIEKAGRGIIDGLALGVIGDNLADAPCALLEGRPTGSSANASANSAGRPEPARLREVRRADAPPLQHGSRTSPSPNACKSRQVLVLREPPVVHVYHVVECGRRLFRAISQSSDSSHCLAALTPAGKSADATSHGGVGPESVVVSRTLTAALGTQTFIPGRLLAGLLPSALLEAYAFWQARRMITAE